MKVIIFYQKPGCSSNKKQKKILRAAGCTLIERNLMQHGMSPQELSSFFHDRPQHEWFNPNAPQIKTGHINPKNFSREEALNLLFMEPILIRRPLMVINNQRVSGFDKAKIETLLNVSLEQPLLDTCSSQGETCTEKRSAS